MLAAGKRAVAANEKGQLIESEVILQLEGGIWSTVINGSVNRQGLFGVWGTSRSNIWAVGFHGTILHYDGTSWAEVASGTDRNLAAVWGSSASDVWAVGDQVILHYNGTGWAKTENPNRITSVWGTSARNIWAGHTGTSFKQIPTQMLHFDGTRWEPVLMTTSTAPLNNPVPAVQSIWGASETDVWAVGGELSPGTTSLFHFNGTTWSTETRKSGILYGVWGSSSSNVSTVGHQGLILSYAGGGWTNVPSGTTYHLRAVWAASATETWAVGGDAGGDHIILRYDGRTWVRESGGTVYTLNSIWGSSANDVWAVGNGGTIMHYSPPR